MSQAKQFARGLQKGLKEFGHCLSAIVNSILLALVYIFGVGLTFIFAKLAGKSFLERKINPKAKTYWSELDLKKKPIKEYYRQF